jgi:hypothetical protein
MKQVCRGGLERGCEVGFRIERKLSKPNSFVDKCIFLSS